MTHASQLIFCRHCGKDLDADGRCPDCVTAEVNPYAAPPTEPATGPRFRLTIGMLLALVGVVAVLLSIALADQVVGVALAAISTPAAGRVFWALGRWNARREPFDAWRLIRLTGSSLFITIATLLASLTAFCVTCVPSGMFFMDLLELPGGPGDWHTTALVLACGVGFLAACLVVWLLRRMWTIEPEPSEKKRRPRRLDADDFL